MSSPSTPGPDEHELDVRGMHKPDKHPTIFAAFTALALGQSLVLVNDHDPRHLRDEFESEWGGGNSWEYLSQEARHWRIRITKLASTSPPRILFDTTSLTEAAQIPDAAGAVWKLETRERDLDSNIIALPPGATIDQHQGPGIDVLIHVISGQGALHTETGTVELTPGILLWMPRRSRREFIAGPEGLRYLTVHQRKQGLTLDPSRNAPRP